MLNALMADATTVFRIDADREIVHVHVDFCSDTSLNQGLLNHADRAVDAEAEQETRCRVTLFYTFAQGDERGAVGAEYCDLCFRAVYKSEVLLHRLVEAFHNVFDDSAEQRTVGIGVVEANDRASGVVFDELADLVDDASRAVLDTYRVLSLRRFGAIAFGRDDAEQLEEEARNADRSHSGRVRLGESHATREVDDLLEERCQLRGEDPVQ